MINRTALIVFLSFWLVACGQGISDSRIESVARQCFDRMTMRLLIFGYTDADNLDQYVFQDIIEVKYTGLNTVQAKVQFAKEEVINRKVVGTLYSTWLNFTFKKNSDGEWEFIDARSDSNKGVCYAAVDNIR
jgi:hypothetical protein